jgi:hypothetical protein
MNYFSLAADAEAAHHKMKEGALQIEAMQKTKDALMMVCKLHLPIVINIVSLRTIFSMEAGFVDVNSLFS